MSLEIPDEEAGMRILRRMESLKLLKMVIFVTVFLLEI